MNKPYSSFSQTKGLLWSEGYGGVENYNEIIAAYPQGDLLRWFL
jgi:hypothetical protein